MTQETKDEYKRYLVSSATTFFAAFLPIMASGMVDTSDAALYGIFLTACRTGLKTVFELWAGYLGKK
jgi:hypothetical protein